MGGGKSQTTTQQVQIPPEVLARYNAVNARADTVAKQPFQQYSGDPNAFVAPMTATQQAGLSNVNQAAGMAQPYYQAASGMTMGGAQNVGALSPEQIQYYQNPYTQAVVAPTVAALQQQQAEQTQGAIGNAIRSGAFGGDRAGIQMANLARQQGLGMAQAINPIYQQAYQNAIQTAAGQQGVVAQDLQRQLAAGQQLAGLGSGAQQALLGGSQAQISAGTTEQQTQQAGLQALYNQFQQERAYPFQIAQFLANIAMGTGSLSGSTTTTTQPAGFFSDERLKENMRPVGKTKDGQTIYSFNYKGDKRTQIGLSAQEVAEKHPEAVGKAEVPGLGGAKALTVDYKKATADAAKKAEGGPLEDKPIAPKAGLMAFQPHQITAVAPAPIEARPTGLSFVSPQPNIAGGVIPIQPFAGPINRAPQAEGLSLGTREGWEAELASLYSGRPLESGEAYGQQRRQQLMDKLAGIRSQRMIEGPVWSDNLARGGYVDRPGYYGAGGRPERARGGMTDMDWANIIRAQQAALGMYGGKSPAGASGTPGSGGGYASMAKNPVAVAKLATAGRPPSARPSGLAQAAATGQQLASLMRAGSGAYDWARNKMSVVPGGGSANLGTAGFNPQRDEWTGGGKSVTTTAPASAARSSLEDMYAAPASDTPIDLGDFARAIELAPFPEDAFEFLARGGRTGYQTKGFVDNETPYANDDESSAEFFSKDEAIKPVNAGSGDFTELLGETIKSGASQPKANPAQPPSNRPQGGDSGVAGLTNLLKTGKSLYDAGSKAASGLGNILGGAEAAGAAGAAEAAGAGLGAAEAAGAGLGALGAEAAGAGAAGALGAEALGAAAAAAPVAAAEALGPAAIAAKIGSLGFSDPRVKHDDGVVGHLFNGQPVHTFKYNNGDNRTRMGLMTTESDRSAVHNIGGLEMLDYKRATDVATGLAPRQAAQTGGLYVDPDMPAEGAVETALNVPRELQPLIAKASAETGIPASIIAAKIAQESGFRKDATGSVGEIGLTQIKPSTARDPGYGMKGVDPESLRDPQANILFGANYLANKARALGLDPSSPEALMAYNAGSAKEKYSRNVMSKAGRYDPAIDAKYADMPAAGAIETAKDVIRPADSRYRFSKEPGQFVKDAPRSAPWRTGGKSLLGSMGVSPDTAEALTSENFVVPALAGIGSMLASTRPTLGGAIGEGLVGGTSAYTALRKQETEEEKAKGPAAVQAETARKTAAETQRLGLYAIPGFGTFYLVEQNGRIRAVTQDEFENLRKSGAEFKQVGAADVPPERLKQINEEIKRTRTPAEPAKVGAGKPEAGKPEAGKPEAGKVTFGYTYTPAIKSMAENEKKVSGNISNQAERNLALESSKDKIKEINAQASASTNDRSNILQVAKDANVIATAEGVAASGTGGEKRIAMLRAMNTIAKMAGKGDAFFGKTISDVGSSDEVLRKARSLSALSRVGTAGQKSYEALNQLAAAFPNANMTSDTIATLTASMIVENQKAIDRNAFWQRYKKDSGGFAANFEEAFKRASPQSKYEAEKKFWIETLKRKSTAAALKELSTNPQEYAKAYDKAKSEQYSGVGRISRYFGVTSYD